MRKDLILVAALSGFTIPNLQADPGGNSSSIVGADRAPIYGSSIEESGRVSERNAARASIAGEVTSSSDREIGAAQEFRGETPGTLGARGTIGQDGTGFTGQERIGTLPPGRFGFHKTNDYDKGFDRANEALKERERSGELGPFDPTGAGSPASSETGRAAQLDPSSKINAPQTGAKGSETTSSSKANVGAVNPSDSGPAGTAGNAGRYNGPVTPGSQSSAVIGKEDSSSSSASAEPSKSKQPGTAQGASASGASGVGTSADTKVVTPPDNAGTKPTAPTTGAVQNNTSEDRQMSARIRRQLLNATAPSGSLERLTPRQLRNVQVKASNNGEVILSGTVATKEEKRDLESMVKEMRGVSSVNNQLTIKGADGKTDNASEAIK